MPAKRKKARRKRPARKRTASKKGTARKKTAAAPAASEPKLLTLTEVARKVKISLPSAQRYKKLYQDRIPSVGKGRKQRYPEEAVAVFGEIKAENLKRRGRPRKKQEAPAPKKAKRARKAPARRKAKKPAPAKKAPEASQTLITLTEISKRTGISYPTCVSYVKKHGRRIPHVGKGRKRRFPEEAVPVFQKIRGQSRRGRRPKAAAAAPIRKARAAAGDKAFAARIRSLEKAQVENAKLLKTIVKLLEQPLQVTVKRG